MELILKQDVQNLGFKDDVVTVKNGYGRNYLIPQGFASLATPSAKKVLAENLKQKAHKEQKLVDDAKKIAEGLKAFNAKDYEKALGHYSTAVTLKQGDTEATNKIIEIEEILDKKREEEEKITRYYESQKR